MAFFEKQKNKTDKFFGEKKYRLSVFGLSPHTDWKMIFTIVLILLAIVCFLGYSLNRDILEITGGVVSPTNEQNPTVDLDEVDQLINSILGE